MIGYNICTYVCIYIYIYIRVTRGSQATCFTRYSAILPAETLQSRRRTFLSLAKLKQNAQEIVKTYER